MKLYFRMDGSGFFLLSAAEQIEKYEEWIEVPVSTNACLGAGIGIGIQKIGILTLILTFSLDREAKRGKERRRGQERRKKAKKRKRRQNGNR